MVEAPTRQRPGSAPVPPQGAPGSFGWLGARRETGPVDSQPLPSTSRGLCTVLPGTRPASCVLYVSEAQGSLPRAPCAYQPRACRTYRVPWRHRRPAIRRAASRRTLTLTLSLTLTQP